LTVMREQFDHELNRSITRIEEAVAPYTRFVRASQEEMERMRDDLVGVSNELRSLRHRIEGAAASDALDGQIAEPMALPEQSAGDA
jgi:hypothetical protein